MGRMGRVALGLVLAAIGAVLLAGTLGLLALDSRRLSEGWPLVFVVIGALVVLEAWAPGPSHDLRAPATGPDEVPDATDLERRLDRRLDQLLASNPTPAAAYAPAAAPAPAIVPAPAAASAPAEVVATEPPQPQPPVAAPEPRQADVVAALLELQGLRRNRLISKQEYRSKRSELVARMSPLGASRPWGEPNAEGEGTMGDAGLSASPYVPEPPTR